MLLVAAALFPVCPAAAQDSYHLSRETYRRIGTIALGQTELPDKWETGYFSVLFPKQRKIWAMAVAHAGQLFRAVTGIRDPYLDGNHYMATAVQESHFGADPDADSFTYRYPAAYPIVYQPAADGDGFMQVVESTAFAELQSVFPERFAGREHADIVAGNRFATSALTAAYYNIFAYQFLAGSGWKPAAFAKAAADPQALQRVLAYGYNRGIWGDDVAYVFNEGRDYCLAQRSLADAAGGCMPNDDDEGSRYVRQVPGYARELRKAVKVGKVGYPGQYDAVLRKADILDYLEAIAPLYSDAEMKRARKAALAAFARNAGTGKTIRFRTGFGHVLDAIMLALPVDTAVGQLCSLYGRCATE